MNVGILTFCVVGVLAPGLAGCLDPGEFSIRVQNASDQLREYAIAANDVSTDELLFFDAVVIEPGGSDVLRPLGKAWPDAKVSVSRNGGPNTTHLVPADASCGDCSLRVIDEGSSLRFLLEGPDSSG